MDGYDLPVHILLVVNGFNDKTLIDVTGQRHLDKNAMDTVIVVKLLDLMQQFGLRDGLGQLLKGELDASLKGITR